jgi:hypothetical protein
MLNSGFEMKNKGDFMLVSVIKYIKNNNYLYNNLERDVYPNIAVQYNTTVKNIKVNIVYSIDKVYNDSAEIIQKYLMNGRKDKPTPKYIINCIVNRI